MLEESRSPAEQRVLAIAQPVLGGLQPVAKRPAAGASSLPGDRWPLSSLAVVNLRPAWVHSGRCPSARPRGSPVAANGSPLYERLRRAPFIRHILQYPVVERVLRPARGNRGIHRFIRYSMVSVVAVAITEVVILVCTWVFGLSGIAANTIGCVAAMPASYELNRKWAWGKGGKSHLWREVVPFWTLTLLGFLASTGHDAVGRQHDPLPRRDRATALAGDHGGLAVRLGRDLDRQVRDLQPACFRRLAGGPCARAGQPFSPDRRAQPGLAGAGPGVRGLRCRWALRKLAGTAAGGRGPVTEPAH